MDYQMRREPFSHQSQVWGETRELVDYAVFWEQGTGKSKLLIDTAAWLYKAGLIDALVIVAPNGVHTNWTVQTDNPETWGELQKHVPLDVPWRACGYHSSRSTTAAQRRELEAVRAFPGLAVLSITYDASAVTDAGKKALWDFLRKRRCMMVLDESARIKTPSAKRTRTLLAAGRYAKFRRILTGTPVSNSPFDVYSQMRFLDPDFWKMSLGIGSFAAFQAEFGVIIRQQLASGRQFDNVVGYRNLDVLQRALAAASSRVLKEDVLDLPPKVYQMRLFQLSKEQQRVYSSLRDEAMAWVGQLRTCEACEGTGHIRDCIPGLTVDDGAEPCPACGGEGMLGTDLVTATMAVTRLLRLQQVTCGYVGAEDGEVRDIPGDNPRLQACRDIADEVGRGTGQIVWARFQRDIDLITDQLRRDGFRVAPYDGRTSPEDRDRARRGFQDGSIDRFVANQDAAGEGLTLTAAKRVSYYSNNFRLTSRLQSEDRAHRIGQHDSVLYDDLIAEGTVDMHIVGSLRQHMDVASAVTGDRLKEWLL